MMGILTNNSSEKSNDRCIIEEHQRCSLHNGNEFI